MSIESCSELVVVMGGYAKGNILTPLAERWIDALRLISAKLILVYDQDKIEPWPHCCHDRDNVAIHVELHGAYDFGSYRRGLAIAEQHGWLENASHVLLCNDSMIGPFWDLNDFVGPMLESDDQLWGISDSALHTPHLQSFFLLMRRDVFSHPAIIEFFKNVVPQTSRHEVIHAYELGFSKLVCNLGFNWKAFLSWDQMHDPRNGQLMGNITAHPLCMLHKGVPLIKVKALTDPRVNFDGLSRTCAYLSIHYPELWNDLWNAYDFQSLWLSTIPVGIILLPNECSQLTERLAWIKSHPHSALKAMIVVEEHEIELRATMMKKFNDELRDNILSVMVVDNASDIRSCFIKMLAGIGTDWIVISNTELWTNPGALQCQIRRLAVHPNLNRLAGHPTVWSQRYCLSDQGLAEIFNTL